MGSQEGRCLPPELWIKIIKMLPRTAVPTCLRVNRLLHDIALPIVFARVVLRFGLLEVDYYSLEVLNRNSDRIHPLEDTVRRHAQELLDRIISDASFASVVLTLQIQACPLTYISEEKRQRGVRTPEVWDWTGMYYVRCRNFDLVLELLDFRESLRRNTSAQESSFLFMAWLAAVAK